LTGGCIALPDQPHDRHEELEQPKGRLVRSVRRGTRHAGVS
jgi:hypothetical protein